MSFSDDLFAESVFLMFALINSVFKAVNVMQSRAKFIELLDMVQKDKWNKLRDSDEANIRAKYSKIVRFVCINNIV